MSTAVTRYIKKHYRKISVRKEVYEKIKEIADRENKPLTDTVKMLVELYEKCRGDVGNG